MPRALSAFLAALALLASGVAWADAAWEQTVRYGAAGRVERFRGAVRGGDVALESVDRGRAALYDAARDRYALLDRRRRAATWIAAADLDRVLASRRKAAEKKAGPLLAALPEGKRTAAEALMAVGAKSAGEAGAEVRETGETRELLGREASGLEISWGEGRRRALWVIREVPELNDAGRRLAEIKRLDLLGGVVDWFPGVRGFPLRSEARSVTKEVTKLETAPVDPARFAVPEGYAIETPEAFLAAKAPPKKP